MLCRVGGSCIEAALGLPQLGHKLLKEESESIKQKKARPNK